MQINSNNKLIVLEGLDGTGKSTIAPILGEMVYSEIVKTPPQLFQQVRRYLDRNSNDYARLYYYMSILAFSSEDIANKLCDKNVIADRYYLSLMVYHSLLSRKQANYSDYFMKETSTIRLRPYCTFLLYCSYDETKRRLLSRGDLNVEDDFILKSKECFETSFSLYENAIERNESKWFKIDTTDRAPYDVANEISELLRKEQDSQCE